MSSYHKPVLLHQSIELLGELEGRVIVDATFGGGGHSSEILRQMQTGRLIAFDKDSDALKNKLSDERFTLVNSDFRFIENELKGLGLQKVDAILADLGISSHQIDTPERGFSFRFDAPLDMRMNQEGELSAADVVNTYSASELTDLFRQYGEIRSAAKIASAIVQARIAAPLETTKDLERVVDSVTAASNLRKILTLIYQALRIEVNSEMPGLDEMLQGAVNMLAPGGRLVIISYHSLEDRKVKNFFRSGNLEGKEEKDFFGRQITPWKVITRKAIKPTDQEIEENPRARSARLRAAEKI